MRSLLSTAIVALAAASIACGPQGRREEGDGSERDAAVRGGEAVERDSAVLVADLLLDALGGRTAWEETRFVGFRWIVEREGEVVADRKHAWDRYTDEYRLEFARGGDTTLAYFNVLSIKHDSIPVSGDVWVDGTRLEGAVRDSALQRAYGIFINDTYWLLMPFKWRDPGVHLAYEGLRELSDGRTYTTVHLTYDEGLGVTEDEFWGFVDPETGLLAAWQYHLQGRDAKGSIVWWRDWEQVGPVRMAMDRRWDDGDARIYFADVVASREVPGEIFARPGQSRPGQSPPGQ